MGRASVLIGAGTVVSRVTGFARIVVLVMAVGATTTAGNAFAVANSLPNAVYAIVSTGLLTAVLVPQIVHATHHPDGGSAFVSKLFTLGTTTLVAVTLLAVVAAPALVRLYAPRFSPGQQAVTTAFAYWCLPQILFYGLYVIVGESLNARNVFGPYTWTPVANNVVSLLGFGAFLLLFGRTGGVASWTPGMVALIGGTATGGIAVQGLLLLAYWRKTGLRLRLDFHWRGVGLRRTARLAGWTFLMVVLGQLAGLVQSRVLSVATQPAPGILVAQNARLLYMLPYSIIVLSIGTPYFTRLSEHAAAGRHEQVRADVSGDNRTLGLFIVIATFAVAAAAVPASRVFTDTRSQAVAAAVVLICYLVSLIPNAFQFTIQRTFHAYNDTRTPFWFTVVQASVVAATALAAQALLPVSLLAAGIALGQSSAAVLRLVLATWLLRRKIGALDVAGWMRATGRFAAAAVPAAGAGWLVFLLAGGVHGWMVSGKIAGAAGATVITAVATCVYIVILALTRTPELSPSLSTARRLIRR